MKVAEFLRQAIENLNIEHSQSDKGIISISLGVNSVIPSREDDMSQFIEQADKALYKSKESGRDRVISYVS